MKAGDTHPEAGCMSPSFACAEVTNDSGQNTVYYADGTGLNPARTSTHPLNASHLLFNVPTGGPYAFTATVEAKSGTRTRDGVRIKP